ncbi:hypothetical protein BHE74_00052009 [Ensete ventricosum]|uniref:Uncharacterized protein n=1 Tax=Ensete ventricosum TaxID=4639 RepID=A0A426ZAH3_ENSVE|nr:hypothetical protein B296_00022930 [Ensete ventricosum]RWW13896.1 hypothetical protein GW17_00022367 [Ensete ventricosum]RWW42447.1 hypothetical protein BHE74_00052009 [Ensete ventricosum]RZS08347.1 hypothetical protein BHM03_00039310 [Ensete ventricosum]
MPLDADRAVDERDLGDGAHERPMMCPAKSGARQVRAGSRPTFHAPDVLAVIDKVRLQLPFLSSMETISPSAPLLQYQLEASNFDELSMDESLLFSDSLKVPCSSLLDSHSNS